MKQSLNQQDLKKGSSMNFIERQLGILMGALGLLLVVIVPIAIIVAGFLLLRFLIKLII